MDAIVALVAVVANIITAGRLICYRRGCSRYRPAMSLLAYGLIVCSGGYAIDVAVNSSPVSPWGAGISVILSVLALRARGNVAAILRPAP